MLRLFGVVDIVALLEQHSLPRSYYRPSSLIAPRCLPSGLYIVVSMCRLISFVLSSVYPSIGASRRSRRNRHSMSFRPCTRAGVFPLACALDRAPIGRSRATPQLQLVRQALACFWSRHSGFQPTTAYVMLYISTVTTAPVHDRSARTSLWAPRAIAHSVVLRQDQHHASFTPPRL